MYTFVLVVHVIVVVLLIVVILIQRGRGAGLVEAFSSAESLFGTKTSSFLVRLTAVLAGTFLLTSLSLTSLSKKRSGSLTEKYKKLLEEPEKKSVNPPLEPYKPAGQSGAALPAAAAAPVKVDTATPVKSTAAPVSAPVTTEQPKGVPAATQPSAK